MLLIVDGLRQRPDAHEEVLACKQAGVSVEVIPGVSSAIAAPELAGMPLTHCGVSQGFTVVSGHAVPDDPRSTLDWVALARGEPRSSS